MITPLSGSPGSRQNGLRGRGGFLRRTLVAIRRLPPSGPIHKQFLFQDSGGYFATVSSRTSTTIMNYAPGLPFRMGMTQLVTPSGPQQHPENVWSLVQERPLFVSPSKPIHGRSPALSVSRCSSIEKIVTSSSLETLPLISSCLLRNVLETGTRGCAVRCAPR